MQEEAFTWREVRGHEALRDGRYASDAFDQHDPTWCGCCFMVAAVQCVEDRARIALAKRDPRSNIRWSLSLQTVIDHLHWKEAEVAGEEWNPCLGGFPELVVECLAELRCPLLLVRDARRDWLGFARKVVRSPAPNAPFRVGEARRIDSRLVKDRIRSCGPVLLEVSADTLKSADETGVVVDLTPRPIDHVVCAVGWTADACWVLRNSWGTRRMPEAIPHDFRCVARGRNECDVQFVPWFGDPDDPGFVKLPMVYEGLDDVRSPWLEVDVLLV